MFNKKKTRLIEDKKEVPEDGKKDLQDLSKTESPRTRKNATSKHGRFPSVIEEDNTLKTNSSHPARLKH